MMIDNVEKLWKRITMPIFRRFCAHKIEYSFLQVKVSSYYFILQLRIYFVNFCFRGLTIIVVPLFWLQIKMTATSFILATLQALAFVFL